MSPINEGGRLLLCPADMAQEPGDKRQKVQEGLQLDKGVLAEVSMVASSSGAA